MNKKQMGAHQSSSNETPFSAMADSLNSSCQSVYDKIRDNPGSAVVIGLAAGLGTGVYLGSLLFPEEDRSYSMLGEMRGLKRFRDSLVEAVSDAIPDRVKAHLASGLAPLTALTHLAIENWCVDTEEAHALGTSLTSLINLESLQLPHFRFAKCSDVEHDAALVVLKA